MTTLTIFFLSSLAIFSCFDTIYWSNKIFISLLVNSANLFIVEQISNGDIILTYFAYVSGCLPLLSTDTRDFKGLMLAILDLKIFMPEIFVSRMLVLRVLVLRVFVIILVSEIFVIMLIKRVFVSVVLVLSNIQDCI